MRALWIVPLMACAGGSGSDKTDEIVEDTQQFHDSAETGSELPNYQSAKICGECHPKQYLEWRQSMHAYAARSPVFEAMNAKAFRDSSGNVATFCTGCHAPVGTELGEDGHTSVSERSAISSEGITCSYCHSAVGHDGPIGNNNILNDPEGPAQGPFVSDSSDGHASEESEFVKSPEFCGSCHDVFSFPALRIEEAFTEYKESPAAAEGIRCQDCHMGPDPGVVSERPTGPSAEGAPGEYPDRSLASHFFVGPDYAMIDDWPFEGDEEANATALAESLARTQKLLENAVKLTHVIVHPDGDKIRVEVNFESKIAGHGFPTGFTSERQAWLSVTVTDSAGHVVYRTGDLDQHGDLRDAHSLDVRSSLAPLDHNLVNLQSRNLLRHGGRDDLSVIETVFPFDADWIEKRNLQPLEERNANFVMDKPSTPYTVDVSLNYRNLPPYLLRALQLDHLVPKLQVFEIASESIVIE